MRQNERYLASGGSDGIPADAGEQGVFRDDGITDGILDLYFIIQGTPTSVWTVGSSSSSSVSPAAPEIPFIYLSNYYVCDTQWEHLYDPLGSHPPVWPLVHGPNDWGSQNTVFTFTAVHGFNTWEIVFIVPNRATTDKLRTDGVIRGPELGLPGTVGASDEGACLGQVYNSDNTECHAVLVFNSALILTSEGPHLPAGVDTAMIPVEPGRAQWHVEQVEDLNFFNIDRCNGVENEDSSWPVVFPEEEESAGSSTVVVDCNDCDPPLDLIYTVTLGGLWGPWADWNGMHVMTYKAPTPTHTFLADGSNKSDCYWWDSEDKISLHWDPIVGGGTDEWKVRLAPWPLEHLKSMEWAGGGDLCYPAANYGIHTNCFDPDDIESECSQVDAYGSVFTPRHVWPDLKAVTNDPNKTPATVTFTYSFIIAGTSLNDPYTGGSAPAVTLEDGVDGSVTHAQFKQEITDALQEWKDLFEDIYSWLTLVFQNLGDETGTSVGSDISTPDYWLNQGIALAENVGDLRFGMHNIDGASSPPNNTLAHAYYPLGGGTLGVIGNAGGDTHFDVSDDWRQDATPSVNVDYGSSSSGPEEADVGAKSVKLNAAHELGHVFGLEHNENPTSLLYPYVSSTMSFVSSFPTGLTGSAVDRLHLTCLYGEPLLGGSGTRGDCFTDLEHEGWTTCVVRALIPDIVVDWVDGYNCELQASSGSLEFVVAAGIGAGTSPDYGDTGACSSLSGDADVLDDAVRVINGVPPVNGDIPLATSPEIRIQRTRGLIELVIR
jgi:hypothetical protein